MTRFFLTGLTLTLALPTALTWAQPTGTEVLDKALRHLEAADNLTLTATMQQRVSSEQMNMSQDATLAYDVAIHRPGKLSVRRNAEQTGDSPLPSADLITDGQTLTTMLHPSNRYSTQPAPQTLAELDSPVLRNDPAGMVVAGILNIESLRAALQGVEPTYVGSEQIDGQPVDHIRLVVPAEQMRAAVGEGQGVDLPMDLYVSSGDQPWVRRIVPDMSVVLNAMKQQGAQLPSEDFKIDLSVSLADWASPEEVQDAVFAFDAPQDATKVEDVFVNTDRTAGGESEAEALVGQPAPDFSLPDLEGNEVKLSDLKGKLVVIDFWATWCGPCVQGLPVVSSVTQEYADQGAVFYALNQQESVEAVRAFLKQQKLDIDVLMDDGEAARSYRLEGIPQTVVIDKEGVVRAVHVGFGPGSEEMLEEDIKKALKAAS